ncbi:pro-resilin-like [Cydia pomonella]|uniref:pro-resilin-like n=1 Tax=Cydia pomonella TaxID=82600 RepID=UPI002ADD798D|nr:pro-resilin-like [Cydia pomonella]
MVFFKALNLLLLATLASCEPPVRYNRGRSTFQNSGYNTPSNTYLPPVDTGFSSPSNSYLPPSSFGGQYEGNNHGHDHGHGHDHEVPKSYEFGYSVKDAQSGNDYDRRESSDGNVVRGEYRVALPDGRTQIVTYHADWQTGFHADVRYEGEARYPEPTRNQNQGYNYQQPSDFSGSLTGFGSRPSTAYGPPGYH